MSLTLDNVDLEYDDSYDIPAITMEKGSLKVIFRGENKIYHITDGIVYSGENFNDTLTLEGETPNSKLEIASITNAVKWMGEIHFLSGQLVVTPGGSSFTDVIFQSNGKILIDGGSVKGRQILAGTDVIVVDGNVDVNQLYIVGSLSVTGGNFWAHTSWGKRCIDVKGDMTIGGAENPQVVFRAEGNATPMEIDGNLRILGNNTKVYIGGGEAGIRAHGMVIEGGILDVSGIHCNGGPGEISGKTCIKTYSLINNGKKVQVGENVKIYLTSNDRSGYLQTDFRNGTGWIVYDGDGEDMHVIPTYCVPPQQSQVQDPANYKNIILQKGDVPESYKIGNGPIEVLVCEDGSQLVYQSNNEAGYVQAGSPVKIISSGKSTGHSITITRRENSQARASVVLDNLNLYSESGEYALDVECPADIMVESSCRLSRASYAKSGVLVRNADVTFQTAADSMLTIGADTGSPVKTVP